MEARLCGTIIALLLAMSWVACGANEDIDKREKINVKCTCRSGSRKAVLACVNKHTGELSDPSSCLTTAREEIELTSCHDRQFCLFSWHPKEWKNCSSGCGGGTQQPVVDCRRHGVPDVPVDDGYCQFQPKPTERVCNDIDCRPRIVFLGWSQCSRTCGDGLRYRQVDCIQKLANGTEVPSRECDISQVPELMQPCHNEPCDFIGSPYVVATLKTGEKPRRTARGVGGPSPPAIKVGTANHWQPKKELEVRAMIGDRVSAVTGTRIVIKCVYAGKPEPRATWFYGDKRIDNDRYLPYSYSYKDYASAIEIVSFQKYLAGTYTCRTENRFGVVKAHTEVRMLRQGEATIFSQRKIVSYGPSIKLVNITIGTNATVYEDTKVNIICPVQVYPYRLRVRWRAVNVKSTRGLRRHGYYGTDLQIQSAKVKNSGTYICTGHAYLGSDSESSTIKVLAKIPPIIEKSSKKLYGRADAFPFVNITIGDTLVAESGAMIEVLCPATGSPKPKITWQRRGVPIMFPNMNMFTKDDGLKLVIKSMRDDASDTYSCVARSIVGQDSAESKITVLPAGAFAPKIEGKKGSVLVTGGKNSPSVTIGQKAEVFEGKPLTVYCPAKGIPKPDISWTFEGTDIAEINDVKMIVDKSGGGLMIVEVTRKIAGTISCIAENVLGTATLSTRIELQGSSQPKILSTGSDVRAGKKDVTVSVVVGNNLKTSGGRKIKLICPVAGWPIPKIMWNKNGKSVDLPISRLAVGVAKGSMLTIENAKETDSGTYTCYAINPAGVGMSTSEVTVLATGSPVITSSPSSKKFLEKSKNMEIDIGTNITTLLGNTMTIHCPFDGDDESQISWTVDSQPITYNKRLYKSGENSLTIENIGFFDNGLYVCKVWNSEGHDSEKTLLRISAPHNQILKASNKISKLESYSADEDLHVVVGHNITVTKGHNIFITCPIRGVMRPVIKWMKGSAEIKSGADVSVEGEQLLLTNVQKDDTGTYSCFARTKFGTSNSSTHLTVIVPTKPMITKGGKDVHGDDVSKAKLITIGDRLFAVKDLTIEINCRVAAGIPKPRISWYHNNVRIVSNGVYATVKENNDLLIPKLDASLQGVYKCVAENMEGKDEATTAIMIMLSVPPNIMRSSKHITEHVTDDSDDSPAEALTITVGDSLKANAGRSVLIDCEATGIPKPRIIWTKDGEDLVNNERIKIFKNGSILIKDTTEEDSGSFACTVINNRGVDSYSSKLKIMGKDRAMVVVAAQAEEKVQVDVNEPEVEVNIGTNVTTLDGKAVTLKCPAIGDPKPKITWYKDAIEIEPSANIDFGPDGELILKQVTVEDAARYTCVVENEYGRDKMSTNVNVATLPEEMIPVPENPESSDLRPRTDSKRVKMNIGMYGDVLSGKIVDLACPTKGSLKPKITWFLNDKEIHPNNMYSIKGDILTIRNQRAGDYDITCKAETFLGAAEMKSSIRFIDPVEPVIHATKKDKIITDEKVRVDIGGNIKVKFGSQLDIECPIVAVPTPKIMWFKDQKMLTEKDDDVVIKGSGKVLRIPFVRMEDNATYACEVNNGIGKKALEKILVGVFKPESPAIMVEPREKKSAALPYITDSFVPTLIREENKTGSIGQNYSILAGMRLVLNCPVSGDPKPEIVWKKDGVPIARDQETLILQSATEVNDGLYVCEATNAFGTQMMESQVAVMKQSKPVIQRNPAKGVKTEVISAVSGKGSVEIDIGDDLQTFIGTEIVIKCPAMGIPAPRLTFYKDGAQIEPNGDVTVDMERGILTVKNALADAQGQYSCVAENSAGISNVSSNVELIVPVAPHIAKETLVPTYNYDVLKGKGILQATVGGANMSTYPGTEVFIDCPVAGFPPPKIVWSKNGKPLNLEYDLVEVRENGTLVLPHVTKDMQGIYACLAVNMGGAYARNITLTVTDPVSPTIEKSSGSLDLSQTLKANINIGQYAIVLDGAEVFIDCPFKAEPEGTVMWSAPEGSGIEKELLVELNEGRTLKIPRADKRFSGLYKCIVSNVFGSDHANTRIDVAESLKPMITSVKENFTSYMGKDEVAVVIGGHLEAPAGVLVTISCPISGTPRPSVKWLYNDRLVHQMKLQSDSEAATYTINKLSLKDTGKYTCIAENVLGSQQASTDISVGLIPDIQTLTKSEVSAISEETVTILMGSRTIVKTGSMIVMQCFANGIPMPYVKWYKDGNLINAEDRYSSMINGMLEIRSVTALDDGSFICVAKNKFGEKKASAQLIVVDPPTIFGGHGNRTEISSKKSVIDAIIGETITVLHGVQLVVRCPTKGIPQPHIQWKRLNAYHDIDPRIGITSDSSLRIDNIGSEDAGIYECIATNKAGEDKQQVNVRVAEPPSTRLSSAYRAKHPSVDPVKSIVVSRDKDVTIVCPLRGTPMPLIKWSKEGTEINADGRKYHTEGDELYIHEVNVKDAGSYRCLAENMAGKNTATFELIVGEPPHITKGNGVIIKHTPTTLKAVVGQSIYLRHHSVLMIFCEVRGNPNPIVNWNKDGKEVERSLMVEGNKVLLLKDVSYTDAGNYTCMVESELGSDQASSELIVVEPASVVSMKYEETLNNDGNINILLDPKKVKTVNAIEGETLKVLCVAEGYPVPVIQWQSNLHDIGKEATEFSFSEKRSIINNGDKVLGRVYATLSMKVNQDIFSIGCQVLNPSGKSSARVTVEHHARPKAPYTGIWVAEGSDSCDGDCLRPFVAQQILEIKCLTYGGKEVSADQCDASRRPWGKKECKAKRCSTKWKVGHWEACSASCGNSGFRKRVVKCMFRADSKITKDEHCSHFSKRVPRRYEPCNRMQCVKTVCKDSSSLCRLVKLQGYCKIEWAKTACCLTCGYNKEN